MQRTGLGRTITKLKKHPNTDVAELAKHLKDKWIKVASTSPRAAAPKPTPTPTKAAPTALSFSAPIKATATALDIFLSDVRVFAAGKIAQALIQNPTTENIAAESPLMALAVKIESALFKEYGNNNMKRLEQQYLDVLQQLSDAIGKNGRADLREQVLSGDISPEVLVTMGPAVCPLLCW